jgi:hypothetical protein
MRIMDILGKRGAQALRMREPNAFVGIELQRGKTVFFFKSPADAFLPEIHRMEARQ